MRIKKYDDYHIKCDKCNDFGQRFSVYQDYFHLFFIPLFPLGKKTIQSVCLKCNDRFNEEKKNYYLSITRTPIYLYTGLILFALMIISIVIGNANTQKQKAAFVANPMINDVYQIREGEGKSRTYYFLKVKNIDSDTLELLHSYFEYYSYISSMSDSDYFVTDEFFRVAKSEIKDYLDKGMLNAVERNYDKSSRFTIEKQTEEE